MLLESWPLHLSQRGYLGQRGVGLLIHYSDALATLAGCPCLGLRVRLLTAEGPLLQSDFHLVLASLLDLRQRVVSFQLAELKAILFKM